MLRPNSIVTTIDYKLVKDLANIIFMLYDYSSTIENADIAIGYMNKIAHRIIAFINHGLKFGHKEEKFVMEIMNKHPEYWHIMKNATDKKPRLIYYIKKYSPFNWVRTYKFMLWVNNSFHNR